MTEQWNTCVGFPSYEVSDQGRVKRIKEFRTTFVGRILKQRINTSGYYYVSLCECGKTYTKYVHHLVAAAFVGARPKDYDIHHIDDNKLNNVATNLEYKTQSDNTKLAFEHGKIEVCKGEKHAFAKLTEDKVRYIKQQLALGKSANKLAIELDVTRSAIGCIKRGLTWKHVM